MTTLQDLVSKIKSEGDDKIEEIDKVYAGLIRSYINYPESKSNIPTPIQIKPKYLNKENMPFNVDDMISSDMTEM